MKFRSMAEKLVGTANRKHRRYPSQQGNRGYVGALASFQASSSGSSSLLFKTGIASAGLASAAYYFDQYENQEKNASQCDLAVVAHHGQQHSHQQQHPSLAAVSSSQQQQLQIHRRTSKGGKGDSASFQILQHLEMKEEFQKIRTAKFLRDIHELAMEESRKDTGIRKRRSTGIRRRKTKNGEISLRNVDLANLSREQERHYQDLLHEGKKMSRDSSLMLADAATKFFLQEETVVDLRNVSPEKVIIVGDLHGSYKCLDRVLELAGKLEDPNSYIVFCGDYVDRGENSLEVFCSLLFLKLAYPKNVIMLRGNHEDILISSVYGYEQEIRKKFGPVDSESIWKAMSQVFSSLPICARTQHALIVHGGLPSPDFNLSDLEGISPKMRSAIESVVDPKNQHEKNLEGILWSDPSPVDGVAENPRGCGIQFGPDVAKDFMDRHGLKYIFRSHEPSEQGAHGMPCGDGKWVVTVFSTALYPNGEGSNYGAVVDLDDEAGTMRPIQFTYEEREANDESHQNKLKAHEEMLVEYVAEHRHELESEFRKIEHGDLVSTAEWAKIMSKLLEMPEEAWMSLQKTLAPTATPQGKYINWKHFLNRYNPNYNLETLKEEQVAVLHEHHEKLLNLFKVLDVDGNGSIDHDEFISGIEMLNKNCLADGERFANPEELFVAFDLDGNGEIDLDEFKTVLEQSKTLKNVIHTVDHTKIKTLQQNHEMLLAAFHFLDRDGSGTIDRDEFKHGIDLLNKRLPPDGQFGDPDELFSVIDEDGSGEIDIDEFSQILQQMAHE